MTDLLLQIGVSNLLISTALSCGMDAEQLRWVLAHQLAHRPEESNRERGAD